MSVNKEVLSYTARRITLSSSKPIKQVVAALQEELNAPKAGQVIGMLATAGDKADIEKGMSELTEDKRTFVLFNAASHSKWMNTYYEGEQSFEESWSFIFGNPLLAKEMLKHDMTIGLYVPPKIVVQAIPGGGTKIIYQAPTSWLGDDAPEVLKKPLQAVDSKMEEVLTRILSETHGQASL